MIIIIIIVLMIKIILLKVYNNYVVGTHWTARRRIVWTSCPLVWCPSARWPTACYWKPTNPWLVRCFKCYNIILLSASKKGDSFFLSATRRKNQRSRLLVGRGHTVRIMLRRPAAATPRISCAPNTSRGYRRGWRRY